MDMTRFLLEPEWPTTWLLNVIGERLVKDRPKTTMDDRDVEEIFEFALNAFIPPDPPRKVRPK